MKRIRKEDRVTIAALLQKYGRVAIEKEVARESAAPQNRGAGRPSINRGFWGCVWANIELRRDRGANLDRLSIAAAADKLAETLKTRWVKPRPPAFGSLKRMYNEAQKLRVSDSEFRKQTDDMLVNIKTRLKRCGPDAISFPALQLPNDRLPMQIEADGVRSALLSGYIMINLVLHNRPDQELRP